MSPPSSPFVSVARALGRDQRGIIVSSIVKIVLSLAVVGLLAIEAGTILFTRLTIQDTAERVAAVAADSYDDSQSVEVARKATVDALEFQDADAKLKRFVVNPADGTVRVVIRKHANTLLADKIGFLKDLTVATGDAVGHPPEV
jgi:uncharacterized membrane protein